MSKDELDELQDKIINPVTIILSQTDDEIINKMCDRIVEYVRALRDDSIEKKRSANEKT